MILQKSKSYCLLCRKHIMNQRVMKIIDFSDFQTSSSKAAILISIFRSFELAKLFERNRRIFFVDCTKKFVPFMFSFMFIGCGVLPDKDKSTALGNSEQSSGLINELSRFHGSAFLRPCPPLHDVSARASRRSSSILIWQGWQR